MTDRNDMERIFAAGGVRPVARMSLRDHELFIGDGFSLPPHRIYRRFGIDEDEFPRGMHVTWWWLGRGETLDIGRPLFFDVRDETRQPARINAAREDAMTDGLAKVRQRNARRN